MKSKLNLLFRSIMLIATFLASNILFSQTAKTGTVLDSTMIAKPAVIPVINIIQKIEDANNEIKLTEKKLQPSNSIIKIDSLYPLYVVFIQNQKKRSERFILANPNRQKVNNLIKKWDGYHQNLKEWESTINNQEERNLRLVEAISFSEKTWELTYQNAIEEKIPAEVLSSTKIVLNDIKSTKKSIINQNNDLLRLDSKINKQKIIVNTVIEELMNLKNSKVYNLFYLRHEPLWKSGAKSPKKNKNAKGEVESISENITGIFHFVKTSENSIALYFVIVSLIILLYVFTKKAYIKYEFNEKDGDLQNAKYIILNHTIEGIIFLSLLVSKLYFTNTPTLFGDGLMLLTLLVSIRLVRPYIYKRFKNIIYFVILLYILDTSKTYIWFTTLQYRIYLLIEAIIVIAILYFFTRPYLKTRKMKIGKFGLFLIRMTPFVYFLSFACIVSNILGYTNLSDITLKISTQSSIITIIFYGMLMIVGGFSTGIIHRHYSIKNSFDANKKLIVEKKALIIIRVLALIWWIFIFLRVIDFLNPVTEFLTNILIEPYKIGSITFTIGAILTFITILVGSFLITSFISFILDESSTSIKFLKLPKGVPAAISLVIRYFIIGFGFVLALSSLGIDLSKFNLMAGALGLGIGFGLQTIISNFVSGLILVFERPLLPGDTVEVNNLLGTVNKVGVRASNISTFDGAEVVVPNNNLISNDLINWTLSDNKKRVEILIGTTYGSDPNVVLKILKNVANEYKDTIKSPEPIALFSEFGDSSLNFRLLFWVHYERGLQAKSDVSINIYNKFKELGIEIPFPQQDIYIKGMPKQETEFVTTNKKSGTKKLKEPLKENLKSEGDNES